MPVDLAIITGAGHGIGREIATSIAAAQADVICISKSDACLATADAIKASGGAAEGLILDVSDLQRAQQVISELLEERRPDRLGVVLAAGILGTPGGIAASISLDEWEQVYRTNVLGNLAVFKGCLNRIIETKFARVVALAGGGAAYAYPEFSAYALSKVAIVRAIENMATELRDAGDMSFVALAPGAVETSMLAQVRAAGGLVRTTTSASEAARFVLQFFDSIDNSLSGRFIHVRDTWDRHLNPGGPALSQTHWKLRRIE